MSDEIPQFLKTEEEQDQSPPRGRVGGYRNERREWGWVILVGIFLLALASGVWGWNRRRQAQPSPTPTASPIALFTSPPVFSPTPTPEAPPKDTYEIEVLNGSGRVGEAGAIRTILEDLGYKVTNADNADSYEYSSAVIRHRPEVEDAFIDELEKVLEKEFNKVTKETDKDLSAQVVVVTGGTRVGATPTPEATAVPTATATPEATSSAE